MSWGPNSTFRFPLNGGTGAIWTAVREQLPDRHFRFECGAERIDLAGHTIKTRAGETIDYDFLVSTIPLDLLLQMIDGAPELNDEASRFVHSSSHIVGIGLRGACPTV